jgi:hypothetical protein
MSLIGSHYDCSPRAAKNLATPLHEADVNTHWVVNDALEKRKSVIKTLSKTRLYGLQKFYA